MVLGVVDPVILGIGGGNAGPMTPSEAVVGLVVVLITLAIVIIVTYSNN